MENNNEKNVNNSVGGWELQVVQAGREALWKFVEVWEAKCQGKLLVDQSFWSSPLQSDFGNSG